MKYKDILITPEDLLDPDNPAKLFRNRELTNIACISLTIELRPLELLAAIKILGQKNVEVEYFQYSSEEDLYSDTGNEFKIPEHLGIDHDIENTKEVINGVATEAPFGARIYTCRLYFRGECIFKITGANTADICYRDKDDEESVIINMERALFNNFMAEVYNDIYKELSEGRNSTDLEEGSVYRNKIYGGIRLNYDGFRNEGYKLIPPKVNTSLHYIVTPVDSINLFSGDKANNADRIERIGNMPQFNAISGAGIADPSIVQAIYNGIIPIAYLPMVYLLRPAWAKILMYDRIIPNPGNDDFRALAALYTSISESTPINIVILVDVKDAANWKNNSGRNDYFLELYNNIAHMCKMMSDKWHLI